MGEAGQHKEGCGAARCGAVPCCAVRCGWCGAVRRSAPITFRHLTLSLTAHENLLLEELDIIVSEAPAHMAQLTENPSSSAASTRLSRKSTAAVVLTLILMRIRIFSSS